MKAVVTVIGKDRTGIIARVSGLLYDHNVNILDITQTILQDLFCMIMLVDTTGSALPFEELQDALTALGRDMGVEVRTQRSDIFEAMNRV
jgi:ACT domain-containing protein